MDTKPPCVHQISYNIFLRHQMPAKNIVWYLMNTWRLCDICMLLKTALSLVQVVACYLLLMGTISDAILSCSHISSRCHFLLIYLDFHYTDKLYSSILCNKISNLSGAETGILEFCTARVNLPLMRGLKLLVPLLLTWIKFNASITWISNLMPGWV